MGAEKEYRVVLVKNILRAVTVMNVPIGNQNTLCVVGVLRMPGGHRDGIKQAETHAASRARMVARRANGAESIAHLPRENRIDSGDRAARCDPGADSALRSNSCIARAELAAVLRDFPLD